MRTDCNKRAVVRRRTKTQQIVFRDLKDIPAPRHVTGYDFSRTVLGLLFSGFSRPSSSAACQGFKFFLILFPPSETFCHLVSLARQGLTRRPMSFGFSWTGRLEGKQRMDTTTKIVLILAVVAIVALFRFDKDLVLIIKALGNIFKLKVSKHRGTENRARSGKTTSGGRSAAIAPAAHPPQPFRLSPWLSRRRLKISLSLVLAGSLIAMPVWWWNCHSEFWKLELANHITDTWTWWTQSPNAITHEVPGRRTLQSLTGLLDDYANVLANDPHRVIELWVVDH